MPLSFTECPANFWVSVRKPSSTRLCIVCGCPIYDRYDAGSRFAAMEVSELSLPENHHFALSCEYWNAELANRFCSGGVFVPGPDPAPTGTLKKLRPPSASPLKGVLASVPLHLQNIPHPASVDTVTDVVKAIVSTTFAVLSLVSEFFDFEMIEYRANVFTVDRLAQAAPFTDPDHVNEVGSMVREGRWVSEFG